MHDGIPYGRNQGQGQSHSREVDRQSPTGLIFSVVNFVQSTVFRLLMTLSDIGSFSGNVHVLLYVEAVTRLSPESCQRMADVKAVDVLFTLMRHCNRSLPHMELLKYALAILLNLSKV